MAERLTSCDIEVHLGDPLEGWDIKGIDEANSRWLARQVIEIALKDAFPGRTAHVFVERTYGMGVELAGYPDDIEPERIREVVDAALAEPNDWVVEEPPRATPPGAPPAPTH